MSRQLGSFTGAWLGGFVFGRLLPVAGGAAAAAGLLAAMERERLGTARRKG